MPDSRRRSASSAARPALEAQRAHRLPARGARPLPQDEASASTLEFLGELKGSPRARCASRGWRGSTGSAWRTWSKQGARSSRRACSRRCSSSAAILHEPDLVILDEPFSGLDPVNTPTCCRTILAEHRAAGPHGALLDAQMEQAEKSCDHILLIHGGPGRSSTGRSTRCAPAEHGKGTQSTLSTAGSCPSRRSRHSRNGIRRSTDSVAEIRMRRPQDAAES